MVCTEQHAPKTPSSCSFVLPGVIGLFKFDHFRGYVTVLYCGFSFHLPYCSWSLSPFHICISHLVCTNMKCFLSLFSSSGLSIFIFSGYDSICYVCARDLSHPLAFIALMLSVGKNNFLILNQKNLCFPFLVSALFVICLRSLFLLQRICVIF